MASDNQALQSSNSFSHSQDSDNSTNDSMSKCPSHNNISNLAHDEENKRNLLVNFVLHNLHSHCLNLYRRI